mgnify:CR=1 FL=1
MDFNFILIVLLVLLILYLYKDTFLNTTYRENFETSSSPSVNLDDKIGSIIVNNYNSTPDMKTLKNLVYNKLQTSGIVIEENKSTIDTLFDTKFRERLQIDVIAKLKDQDILKSNNESKINEYIKMIFASDSYKDSKSQDVIPSAIELVSLIKDLLDYDKTEDPSNLQYRLLEEQAQQNTYSETTKDPNLQNTMQNLKQNLKDQLGEITPEMEQQLDTILSGSNLPDYLTNDDVKQILEQISAQKSGQSYPSSNISIDLSDLKQTIIDSMKEKYQKYMKTTKEPSFYDVIKMLYDLDLFEDLEKNFESLEEKQMLYRLILGDKMVSDPSNNDKSAFTTSFDRFLRNNIGTNGWKEFADDYPGQDLDTIDKTEFERIQDWKKKNRPLNAFDKSMLELSKNEAVNYVDEKSTDECALDQPCNKNPIIIPKNLNTLDALFGNTQRDPNPNQTSQEKKTINKDNYDKLLKIQQNILTSLNKVVKNMTEDKHYSIDFE